MPETNRIRLTLHQFRSEIFYIYQKYIQEKQSGETLEEDNLINKNQDNVEKKLKKTNELMTSNNLKSDDQFVKFLKNSYCIVMSKCEYCE